MITIFKIIGAIGIILICSGIITKKRKIQDIYYILGGICLEIYSISISDVIFMILQAVFIFTASYSFIKDRYKTK